MAGVIFVTWGLRARQFANETAIMDGRTTTGSNPATATATRRWRVQNAPLAGAACCLRSRPDCAARGPRAATRRKAPSAGLPVPARPRRRPRNRRRNWRRLSSRPVWTFHPGPRHAPTHPAVAVHWCPRQAGANSSHNRAPPHSTAHHPATTLSDTTTGVSWQPRNQRMSNPHLDTSRLRVPAIPKRPRLVSPAMPGVLTMLGSGEARSGPELARRLGISRAAVWKQVAALRATGLDIESGNGGYRLARPLDGLDPAIIRSRLAAPVRRKVGTIENHWRLDSTSSECLRRAYELLDRSFVFADWQDAGRGRRGR
ncbi:MAG: HTH domain-containing protein, partial [Rhodanobacteraceae bacterium]